MRDKTRKSLRKENQTRAREDGRSDAEVRSVLPSVAPRESLQHLRTDSRRHHTVHLRRDAEQGGT
jgi:hypothetical protein